MSILEFVHQLTYFFYCFTITLPPPRRSIHCREGRGEIRLTTRGGGEQGAWLQEKRVYILAAVTRLAAWSAVSATATAVCCCLTFGSVGFKLVEWVFIFVLFYFIYLSGSSGVAARAPGIVHPPAVSCVAPLPGAV